MADHTQDKVAAPGNANDAKGSEIRYSRQSLLSSWNQKFLIARKKKWTQDPDFTFTPGKVKSSEEQTHYRYYGRMLKSS